MSARDLLRSWTRLARRRWKAGAAAFVVVTAVGAALLFLGKPVHRAEAALRLGQPPPPGGVSPTGGILSFFQFGGDPFANDLELLGSRSLAEAIVEEHALNAVLDAPRLWYRDSVLVSLEAGRDTRAASYVVRWDEEGRIVVRTSAGDTLKAQVTPGEPALFGGVTAVFKPWRAGMPREVGISTRPFGEAARSVRSALEVERTRREANVVALAYQHADPALAEGVVASAVEGFVALRTALADRESSVTTDSLRRVAARTAEELAEAEAALERVQRDERIVAPEVQAEALVQRQAELAGRLRRGRAELSGVDEMLRRLDAVGDPGESWTALLSYPAFLENQTLGEILARLTELHGERETLATRRAEGNRELGALDEQIAYLDRSLRSVAREYRAGLVEQIAALEPQVAEVEGMLAGLPARALELGRRQRDVRLLGEVLVLTEQRTRQEELREALTYANVQVIDPPALRDRPVWPRKKLGLLVVLVLASGTALLAMVVREHTDGRVRTGSGVRAVLDAPVLGVVRRGAEGRVAVTPAQAEAIGRRIHGGRLVLVAPDDDGPADELASALAAAGSPGGNGRLARPAEEPASSTTAVAPTRNGGARSAGTVADSAAAAEVASVGAAVAVVVELGRTRTDRLVRLRRLLDGAGASVGGAIVVCASALDEEASWE